ncbi:MAG TPA: hypothetical protein VGM80_03895 [Gaiellaceae bacterium]|jgi:hypothetical protein
MASRVVLGLALALLLAGSASAGDPWKLRCASMPLEQRVPAPLARAEHAFEPWGPSVPLGLRAGPVYLLAGSYRTAVSRDGDFTDSTGAYLHRALVAVAPSSTSEVTITGRRLGLGARSELRFSTNGAISCRIAKLGVTCDSGREPLLRFASTLTVPPGSGWRVVRTEIRIPRTGCFELQATGQGLDDTIPLSVPGPDFRASGG